MIRGDNVNDDDYDDDLTVDDEISLIMMVTYPTLSFFSTGPSKVHHHWRLFVQSAGVLRVRL